MISLSLSNFIKSILNIQDNNISFLEEDYCQVIQNGNYVVKVFKGFLKADYSSYPHCSSKKLLKMVLGNVISNLFPFKITILSLILVFRITLKDLKIL